MGVFEGRGRLSKALQELMNRWLETRATWDDANSARFEKEFLLFLEADVRTAGSAMEHMAQVLQQVRRDCE